MIAKSVLIYRNPLITNLLIPAYFPAMTLPRGARLGPYEIEELIGRGRNGRGLSRPDTRLGRDVAIKVLPSHLARRSRSLARFGREARAVAALSHPNIVAVFDVGAERRHAVRRHRIARRRDAARAARGAGCRPRNAADRDRDRATDSPRRMRRASSIAI